MATPAGTETLPINPRAYLRLVALSALIGIPAALVAAMFLALVHTLEGWLSSRARRHPTLVGQTGP